MSATRILWGQIACVLTIVLITTWAATQWTAWRLGYQPQLGHPWFELVPGVPIYLPPAFLLTVDLPANVHRDLAVYADLLARETGQSIPDPAKLVAPMLARFMATDRAFAKARRESQPSQGKG